jgi:hypothetical protein
MKFSFYTISFDCFLWSCFMSFDKILHFQAGSVTPWVGLFVAVLASPAFSPVEVCVQRGQWSWRFLPVWNDWVHTGGGWSRWCWEKHTDCPTSPGPLCGRMWSCYQQRVFSEDLGLCIPNGRIQAEHIDGWGRKALLREEESLILPGKGREEEGSGSLGRLFLYYLELGGGETIVITWLLSPVG